jgi:hypothetical protein
VLKGKPNEFIVVKFQSLEDMKLDTEHNSVNRRPNSWKHLPLLITTAGEADVTCATEFMSSANILAAVGKQEIYQKRLFQQSKSKHSGHRKTSSGN